MIKQDLTPSILLTFESEQVRFTFNNGFDNDKTMFIVTKNVVPNPYRSGKCVKLRMVRTSRPPDMQ